ncbi:MAG TPA: thioredoxin family protein [Acetobacteraceae bacterium]|nr:thioredoxin family protein [Acetobacteraceae bacterium]
MKAVAAALAVTAILGIGWWQYRAMRAHAVVNAPTIAWHHDDVADAFAEARESGKPVLLYWGAKWCPPCARLKVTAFKDPAFVAETRNFVPVYLDGDSKGAQAWGQRFGIMGYPTVIILRPDGAEITRLSSGIEPAKLSDVLRLTAGRTMSAEALLRQADTDPRALSAQDWQLLAGFDWQDDPRHFGDAARTAALLTTLAAAAPDPALGRRLALLAVTEALDTSGDKPTLPAAQQKQAEAVLPVVLASYAEVRLNHLDLSEAGASMIEALPDAATRDGLHDQLLAAMDRVYADTTLPMVDRVLAAQPAVDFAKATPGGRVPDDVLAKVRERAAWADRTAHSPMERQSVIDDAAVLLADAGDRKGGEAMLQAELSRSATPFYYMSDLSDLAEKDKDIPAALAWARRAAAEAQGPASRVQWAILYAEAVVRLTPGDSAEIERSADQVVDELARNPDGYHERTQKKLAAWDKKLRAWSDAHGGGAVLARVTDRMKKVCAAQTDAAAGSACAAALTAA